MTGKRFALVVGVIGVVVGYVCALVSVAYSMNEHPNEYREILNDDEFEQIGDL